LSDTGRPGPLSGLLVADFSRVLAGPYCTMLAADMGARVIKIERPGAGDFARGNDERVSGPSSHFVWTNRSKESITLDVKQSSALDIIHKLLADADVFVQNLAPGATQRLGLDFAALSARYPRLIVCDISGYGADGPMRDKKAYDLLI
jgi:crotonobetainyl-CoA:carnitine CoA-transferase CaiB-like acyl-CoA transferase